MYTISFGPAFYGPMTLPEAWREVHGVGCARIWCGNRQMDLVRRYIAESDIPWMRGDPLPFPYEEWRAAHA